MSEAPRRECQQPRCNRAATPRTRAGAASPPLRTDGWRVTGKYEGRHSTARTQTSLPKPRPLIWEGMSLVGKDIFGFDLFDSTARGVDEPSRLAPQTAFGSQVWCSSAFPCMRAIETKFKSPVFCHAMAIVQIERILGRDPAKMPVWKPRLWGGGAAAA